ncbi:MAG: hypothetical protein WCJ44_17790 [Runella sp.]|jgi:hypothetical protein|uniref:hypothetical protein n=1 Tax=Runella sp. TaxID=1960881 RepID=UPI00261AD082|nr:hypothetical protein [Runella sp.]
MTNPEFLHVKALFDQGLINIQNAELDAFLYDNKWYPLRLFVNQVHNNVTNHYAIKILVLLIPYIKNKRKCSFSWSK